MRWIAVLGLVLLGSCVVQQGPTPSYEGFPAHYSLFVQKKIRFRDPPPHVHEYIRVILGVYAAYTIKEDKWDPSIFTEHYQVYWVETPFQICKKRKNRPCDLEKDDCTDWPEFIPCKEWCGVTWTVDDTYVYHKPGMSIADTALAHEIMHNVAELLWDEPDPHHQNKLFWKKMVPAANATLRIYEKKFHPQTLVVEEEEDTDDSRNQIQRRHEPGIGEDLQRHHRRLPVREHFPERKLHVGPREVHRGRGGDQL